jgi:hypothetical protein
VPQPLPLLPRCACAGPKLRPRSSKSSARPLPPSLCGLPCALAPLLPRCHLPAVGASAPRQGQGLRTRATKISGTRCSPPSCAMLCCRTLRRVQHRAAANHPPLAKRPARPRLLQVTPGHLTAALLSPPVAEQPAFASLHEDIDCQARTHRRTRPKAQRPSISSAVHFPQA